MSTRSRAFASVLFAVAIGSLPSAASAVATYSYQGVPFSVVGAFQLPGNRIVGELTFDEPLAPNLDSANVRLGVTDFHFNDGLSDYDLFDLSTVILSTDEQGAIVAPYTVSIITFPGFNISINETGVTATPNIPGPCVPGICHREPSFAGPGQWAQVPEPASALLLAGGLGWLGRTARRQSSLRTIALRASVAR